MESKDSMKNSHCDVKKRGKTRKREVEIVALLRLLGYEHDEDDLYSLGGDVMTRGFYVWSKASLHVLSRRMNVDVIYFTAAGDIHRGDDTFHVCEVLVRNTVPGKLPLVVATMVFKSETTLNACMIALIHSLEKLGDKQPKMIVADGPLYLLNSVFTFAGAYRGGIHSFQKAYYRICTNSATKDDLKMPICLAHPDRVMEYAMKWCRKLLSENNFGIGLRVFQAMLGVSTMEDLELLLRAVQTVFGSYYMSKEVYESLVVIYSSSYVEYQGEYEDESPEDQPLKEVFKMFNDHNQFESHFAKVMDEAFLQAIGTCRNMRFCPEFAEIIRKLFVPMVALWTGLLTGDLGRHGKGPVYNAFHNNYVEVHNQTVQNFTQEPVCDVLDKETDDKVRCWREGTSYEGLDDFVVDYKASHKKLVMSFLRTSGIKLHDQNTARAVRTRRLKMPKK